MKPCVPGIRCVIGLTREECGFGVLLMSCVCVSRVLFSVGVCVCETLWGVFVWVFGVLFLSCVCVGGVVLCWCVCVCDLLIFLPEKSVVAKCVAVLENGHGFQKMSCRIEAASKFPMSRP